MLVSPGNVLIADRDSINDFTVFIMTVLRYYGIPIRAVLDFYGAGDGDSVYIFNSGMGILWDEAFVNGWLCSPHSQSMVSHRWVLVIECCILGIN